MTASISSYTVGYGRPPLHSRFKKGQSGNPSGKPGPAKLAKQRFQHALFAALEGSEAEVEKSSPDNLIAKVAKRIALDAAAGRIPAVRLLLSLIDTECKLAEVEEAAREAEEAEALSLLQGNSQGNGEKCLEDILWPNDQDWMLDGRSDPEPDNEKPAAAPAPERNRTQQVSLQQGKRQGNGKLFAGESRVAPEWKMVPVAARTQADKRSQLMMSAAVPR